MQRMDNELLVDSNFSSASMFSMDNVACDAESLKFGSNLAHSPAGSDANNTESPEPEGNINTAMDVYAPDQSSVSSSNSRISTSSELKYCIFLAWKIFKSMKCRGPLYIFSRLDMDV